jgi:hypothetical protein
MGSVRVFGLEAIRTDGWFERVGEKVGSFEALCSILGDRFFAFSLITGARVTALTVDRREPNASIVEFEVSGASPEDGPLTQRLTLDRFRRRLVSALLAEENMGPAPLRETDVEGIQRHIGVRVLLLAPLFGYSLLELRCSEHGSTVFALEDGVKVELELGELRQALRRCVVEEMERFAENPDPNRSGLDLTLVPKARDAAAAGEHDQVVTLLGGWLMPLAFFLRTPEGRILAPEVRAVLGEGLGLLGSSLLHTGDQQTADQSLRLAVQYSVGTSTAADAYARLGAAHLRAERFGEAIAPLRRAAELGAEPSRIWPGLGLAFFRTDRLLASWAALRQAEADGVQDAALPALQSALRDRLPALGAWEQWCQPGSIAPTHKSQRVHP